MISYSFFRDINLRGTFVAAIAMLCVIALPLKLQAQMVQVLDNGINTAPINFPAAKCTYRWTNDNPSIGLAASGSGNIASFKATNNGIAPVTANITAIIQTTPNNYGYTYSNNNTVMSLLDMNTLTKVRDIEIPNARFLGVNADGTILYVSDGTPNTKTINLASVFTGKKIDQITISRPVGSLIQSEDGGKIYTYDPSNDGKSGVVSVIDVASKTEEAPILIPPDMQSRSATIAPRFMLSADGTKLFLINDFGNTNGVIAAFSTATKNLISRSPANRPTFMTESRDGTKLYVISAHTNNINIYDIASGAIERTFTGTEAARSSIVSKDGTKLFVLGVKNIDVIDFTTNTISQLNTGLSGFSELRMTGNQDGSRIYVLEWSSTKILIVDADDGSVRSTIDPKLVKNMGVSETTMSQFIINSDGTKMHVASHLYDIANDVESDHFITIDLSTNRITEQKKVASPMGFGIYTIRNACTASTVTIKITVNPDPPTITPSVTSLAGQTTTYGTPSAAATFTVSGKRINNGILVTPPAGFEVSLNGTTYTNTVTVPGTGDINNTTVHVRLKATTNAGNAYGGNMVLNNGTLNVNINIATSRIDPATLTLTAKNVSKTYGTKLEDANGSTAFTPTGLQNGDVIGSVSVKYGTGALATDGVKPYPGSVTISAPVGGTFLASNYSVGTLTPADIIVEPAELTVTADDKQRYFGEDNPALTFKYSGFVPGEDETQLTTKPTASTTATLASPLGNYPIILSGGVAANYKITHKAGTLSIISRMITPVTAFTPNGDGINDTWSIPNITQYPKCTVEVFSRSGSLVFQNIGYTKAWDGRYAQTDLPAGTYYYIIKLGNGTKPITGTLAMIR